MNLIEVVLTGVIPHVAYNISMVYCLVEFTFPIMV